MRDKWVILKDDGTVVRSMWTGVYCPGHDHRRTTGNNGPSSRRQFSMN